MNCPKCNSDFTTVLDSRPSGVIENGRRRRYICHSCQNRWTTIEAMMDDDVIRDFIKRREYDDEVIKDVRDKLSSIEKILCEKKKPLTKR